MKQLTINTKLTVSLVVLLLCVTSRRVSAQCNADFDLVFVVDSSGSIRVSMCVIRVSVCVIRVSACVIRVSACVIGVNACVIGVSACVIRISSYLIE